MNRTESRAARREAETIELRLLLEAIFLKYGYDFRNYGRAHLRRRLQHRMAVSGIPNLSELTRRVLYDPVFFESMLADFSVNVTEFFRDPSFFRTLRLQVIPMLDTYPFVKIWHAGCASGEEVYSMAIVLVEEGIYDKCRIYATDLNKSLLDKAKQGIYAIRDMKTFTANYQRAGGTGAFSDYYTARYESAIFKRSLRERIIFADHNLATDAVFQEMHLIVCRNVLIYFNRTLQARVIGLFVESLAKGGFLCVGSKESLRFSGYEGRFDTVSETDKIYRKRMLTAHDRPI